MTYFGKTVSLTTFSDKTHYESIVNICVLKNLLQCLKFDLKRLPYFTIPFKHNKNGGAHLV